MLLPFPIRVGLLSASFAYTAQRHKVSVASVTAQETKTITPSLNFNGPSVMNFIP